MEKHEIIEAPQFPEEMIQHIQSFLSEKESAQTTILSKSWYNAWLTRPTLEFFATDIRKPTAFVQFVDKTLQRYDESNLKIWRFKLSGKCNASDPISWAAECTKKAMKLGATDIDIEFLLNFVLPREVFESESLVGLSMQYGIIDLHKVSCWRLKSLNLRKVRMQDNNYNIWDIIWKCPLIEEFELSTRLFALCNSSFDYLVLKPGLIANDFHKLKVLSLETVEIGEWLFRDLSSKFPYLKELTLKYCTGFEEVQIYSGSLERIVLFESCSCRMSRVEFDVPRICRFEFESLFVPSLSFKTTSTEWESHITFRCMDNSSWLVEFSKFLMELSSSEIYLRLWFYINFHASHVFSLPKPPIVEKLWLYLKARSLESTLLEELFWSCRPNFIILSLFDEIKNCVIERICNSLIKQECGMHDLEEVNVVISGHTAWTWSRNLLTNTPCASAFVYSGSIGPYSDTDIFHLQLKWG